MTSYHDIQYILLNNTIRESERVSGRRPEMRVVGQAVCLTIYAAQDL